MLSGHAENRDRRWHLAKIPKVMSCYWGGDKLPFLRYLTVYGFSRLNPDWTIRVHYPKTPYRGTPAWQQDGFRPYGGEDFFPKLRALENVEFVEFDIDALHLFPQEISESHRADLLRWHIFATSGGVWSDMDILYFKPLSAFVKNTPAHRDADLFVCINDEHVESRNKGLHHSIGFLMSRANNPFFKDFLGHCLRSFDSTTYQSVGAFALDRTFPTVESIADAYGLAVENIPMDVVYFCDCFDVEEIIHGTNLGLIKDNSIGLHWYGGHPLTCEVVNALTPETVTGRTLLEAIVRRIWQEGRE